MFCFLMTNLEIFILDILLAAKPVVSCVSAMCTGNRKKAPGAQRIGRATDKCSCALFALVTESSHFCGLLVEFSRCCIVPPGAILMTSLLA